MNDWKKYFGLKNPKVWIILLCLSFLFLTIVVLMEDHWKPDLLIVGGVAILLIVSSGIIRILRKNPERRRTH